MVAQGVIGGDLPYELVGIGVMIGLVLWFLKIPILPAALGVYLPLSLSTATMVGGVVKAYVDRKTSVENAVEGRGTLLASGLVGGDACIGVVIALLAITGVIPADAPAWTPEWVSFAAFGLLAIWLGFFSLRRTKR